MKKILVTGATGFIGNYVIEELLKLNYIVTATSFNAKKAAAANWYKKVRYIQFDLKQFDSDINYYTFFGEPDLMIHLAWEGLPNYKQSFHVEENLPRHLVFLQNLIANGLTDLTVTGTCLEYGMQEGCLSEDTPCKPSNPYAIAKHELCKKLLVFQSLFSFHFKWIRLFYMYGQGQSPNSLVSQLETALDNNEAVFNMSGGEQERDYLPISEVVTNIIKIVLQNKISGIINCCSGKPVKIKDFIQRYLDSKDSVIKLNLGFYPYADYEPLSFWGDSTKLQSIS